MAIVNSIAIGKSSGSLGNIVFQVVQGRTVARQKNTSISTPQTPAQVAIHNQFLNCILAYKFMKSFIEPMRKMRRKGENLFNLYMRLTAGLWSSELAINSSFACAMLKNKSIGATNVINIIECNNISFGAHAGGTEILFYLTNIEKQNSMYINVFAIDGESELPVNLRREMTLSEKENGLVIVPPIQMGNNQSMAFIDANNGLVVSNIRTYSID